MLTTSNEPYAIVISDTHGCKDYVDFAKQTAEYIGAKGVFHLGDLGGRKTKYFLDTFKDYDTFIVFGNHDKRQKVEKLIKNYPNARIIDDEVIKYYDRKLIGMGLKWHMCTNFKYKRKLKKLLKNNPDALLLSHYGRDSHTLINHFGGRGHLKLMKRYNPVQLHGHDHDFQVGMYLKCKKVNFKEKYTKPKVYHENKYNVSFRVLMLPLKVDTAPYYLDSYRCGLEIEK